MCVLGFLSRAGPGPLLPRDHEEQIRLPQGGQHAQGEGRWATVERAGRARVAFGGPRRERGTRLRPDLLWPFPAGGRRRLCQDFSAAPKNPSETSLLKIGVRDGRLESKTRLKTAALAAGTLLVAALHQEGWGVVKDLKLEGKKGGLG